MELEGAQHQLTCSFTQGQANMQYKVTQGILGEHGSVSALGVKFWPGALILPDRILEPSYNLNFKGTKSNMAMQVTGRI